MKLIGLSQCHVVFKKHISKSLHMTAKIKQRKVLTMSTIKTGDAQLDEKIKEWMDWDKNEETRNALHKLVEENNIDELKAILLKRLSFGTAGLRGKMAVGYACMNDLVIVQTAQGFLKYLEKKNINLLRQNGIVVGYDGRHNSKKWAEITATIFINGGYPVKLFSQVTPTPFIPFSVKKFKCASGVMVTASHNPKEDNGYKVYGPNSAQIIPPADKDIQNSILENLGPLETSWNISAIKNTCMIKDPLEDVLNDYIGIVCNSIHPELVGINSTLKMTFVYTAMHGVGYPYVQKVCDAIGIKIIPVLEQKDPHPDFPTVKFPNPEEGKSSLDLAFKTAEANNSVVILANDPDADRMAAAEKNGCDQWRIFSGNELGALFGWWMLYSYKLQNPNKPLSDVCMISSTVSSMILRSMSKKEGFNFYDTLTGFKWIGNLALDLEKKGNQVIFCFEEAIGFMCSSHVVDKDGVSALYQFATMASYLYYNQQTLAGKLEEIYATYGQHISSNSYYICHDPVKINAIFERIRNFNGPKTYPESILNGKYKITSVRDLTTDYDSSQPNKKAILPVDPSSQMITFQFDNGLVCTLRTSGTEPKVKYYTELCASPEVTDKAALRTTLTEMVKGICEELLEPDKNGLTAKKD